MKYLDCKLQCNTVLEPTQFILTTQHFANTDNSQNEVPKVLSLIKDFGNELQPNHLLHQEGGGVSGIGIVGHTQVDLPHPEKIISHIINFHGDIF